MVSLSLSLSLLQDANFDYWSVLNMTAGASSAQRLGLRVCDSGFGIKGPLGLYWVRGLEGLGLYRGYIGMMEKNMETSI